jgi:adhesin/invasin
MQRSAMERGIRACSTGRWAVAAAALVAAAACGDTTFNTITAIPTTLTFSAASSGQTGTVGQPLAQPISVQVTDQAGNPIIGVVVTWTVLSGGGSVSSATSTTDVNGDASVIWTLGTVAGTNTLRASIATGASADISAEGVSAAGSTMAITSGNPQTITLGATTAPMVVHVADQFGNAVAGATVTWTTTGGTLSATSTTTDASGNAQVTLDTSGPTVLPLPVIFTVTASSGTLPSAVFTITAM